MCLLGVGNKPKSSCALGCRFFIFRSYAVRQIGKLGKLGVDTQKASNTEMRRNRVYEQGILFFFNNMQLVSESYAPPKPLQSVAGFDGVHMNQM